MRFSNKVALVTGASSGIGRDIALRLAHEGADVAVNYDQNEAGAKAVAERIEAMGRRCMTVQADVTQGRQVEDMIELVTGAWGGLDVLVNNAGVVRRGALMEITEEMWDAVLDVNLKGVFLCCQSAARWMIPRKQGAIVNVSSMRGVEGGSNSCHYAAAKAGVNALTKTLARELAPLIRVNAVAPGYVDTRIQADLTEAKRQDIIAGTPLARFGEPADISAAVAFLASAEAAYITGQTLLVDGGRVML
ncbi:MAG: 3-oxoacyl-acyl-carrier protein reductase [Cyanobacteria bacterium RYN_339]|nr:3-oxoacyl-acyl-carrier protein reductase [Cyanobacteria bacterium RYN_339]